MRWLPLRKNTGESLAISMAGIKLGDRLLVVGCSDALLIARLATKTGLTGRAHAVDADQGTVQRAAQIALRDGALVETSVSRLTTLPLESAAFDVAIVRDALRRMEADTRVACLSEVRRVLRPGGRCLVIDSLARGLRALMGSARDYEPVPLLQAAGFKAARVLAEREGLAFAEGVKPT